MNDHQSDEQFIAAIVQTPDDNGLRRRYADWLSGHGNPLGEFIRVQCQQAECSNSAPESKLLNARAKELFIRHGDQWLGSLGHLGEDWQFERGFVTSGTVRTLVYLANAEELFAAAPLLTGLQLEDAHGKLGDILGSPYFRRLQRLDLSGNELTEEDVINACDNEHAARSLVGCALNSLELQSNERKGFYAARAAWFRVAAGRAA